MRTVAIAVEIAVHWLAALFNSLVIAISSAAVCASLNTVFADAFASILCVIEGIYLNTQVYKTSNLSANQLVLVVRRLAAAIAVTRVLMVAWLADGFTMIAFLMNELITQRAK